MAVHADLAVESPRLEALIRHQIGWQIDSLEVLIEHDGLILRGHANCAFARVRAVEAARRLAGVPVVANEITVN
jgi:hypothetical protein